MHINLKKRGIHMLLVFVVVAFLFWFLFMRKREGFLEGAAPRAIVPGQPKGVNLKEKGELVNASTVSKTALRTKKTSGSTKNAAPIGN